MPVATAGRDPADGGIDVFRLKPADVIVSLTVLNGEATQAATLDGRFADIPAAVEALNAFIPRSCST